MFRKERFFMVMFCLSLIPKPAASGVIRHATLLSREPAATGSQSRAEQAREEILTNESVIQLLKVGLDEDTIIAKIRKTKYSFDMSTQDLVAIKQAGASSRLIQFMIDPTKEPQRTTPKGPPIEAKGKLGMVIIPRHGVWLALNGTNHYLLRTLPKIRCDLPSGDIRQKQDGSPEFTIRDYQYYIQGYLGETLATPMGKLSVINVYFIGRAE